MPTEPATPPAEDDPPPPTPEERLERGDLVVYAKAPFPLPEGDDLDFLLRQELAPLGHKNISYDPGTGRLSGHVRRTPAEDERFRSLLACFSQGVTAWLAEAFPRYTNGWQPDRASFRPLEEATRRLRPTARNDLLHIDSFPNRPTGGRRILRVYANVNPTEPRIWVTSDPFARLLVRYGAQAGLPGRAPGWLRHVRAGVLRLFDPRRARRSAYDSFMLRFHDFLKLNNDFQERGAKRRWAFPPGSAWLAMTDACCHADLRGRYALEHSYFIAPEALALPDESPAALLTFACTLGRAA
jgi:hypothetical protein